jgi:hypothetical protein
LARGLIATVSGRLEALVDAYTLLTAAVRDLTCEEVAQ